MNRRCCLILVWLLGAGLAHAGPKTYELDPVHSCVLFRLSHLYTQFTGRFNTFSGVITGDPADPASFQVKAEVAITSIDTANKTRETHLLSPDFFDAAKFAKATFVSTRTVPGKENTAQVTGKLTIRDVAREVTFDTKLLGHGPDMKGVPRVGLHAETRINRRDFGVSFGGSLPNGVPMLGDEVTLILDLEAFEKTPADPASAPAAPAPTAK